MGYAIHSIFPAVDTYLLGSLPDYHRASVYSAHGAGMMPIQAPGSLLVGLLRDAGVSFPTIFEWMGGGLVALVVLQSTAVFPRLHGPESEDMRLSRVSKADACFPSSVDTGWVPAVRYMMRLFRLFRYSSVHCAGDDRSNQERANPSDNTAVGKQWQRHK